MIVKVTGNHRFVRFSKPYPEMEFRETMSFRVKGWMFIPSVKSGNWDGYVSLLKHHQIPTGLYRTVKSKLEKNFEVEFEEDIQLSDPPPLMEGLRSNRDYQNDCVDAMVASIEHGGGTILAATSSGKTAITGLFYSRVAGNHLFVVDQVKLLYQAQKDLAAFLKEPVGAVGNGKFEPQRVTVATVQTLMSVGKQEKLMRYLGALETVTVDEIHVQLNARNFEIVNSIQPRARFGLTATLQLHDYEVWLRIGAFSGPVVYEYPIERGIAEGVLSKVHYYQIRFKPVVSPSEIVRDREAAKNFDGIVDKTLLKRNHWRDNVLNHPEKMRCLRKLCRGYLKRDRYIVVLAERLPHIAKIKENLQEFLPRVVKGGMKIDKIDRIIERFEAGINRLIIASRVFNKGVSINRIDTILNVGETEDANTIIQQIGRELRLHPDKGTAIFVDFGGSTGKSRENAEARLQAVKAKGIPTTVFDWDRDQTRLWTALRPPKRESEAS